ncbi:hypothetical protein KOR42_34230 [Thalassoglobus neptunius]|uniref:Uncharacterized protein n=1 Tax=Thalassoglobus neptunius TaxID=1938619 RepID=A0A5C5WLR7_9PLAN|nr:hypothetical protein [Thalassoglobus neptunius]TWT51736.1 hypothetical protein KOR42_34230 [Thalassoglobus neptunius]
MPELLRKCIPKTEQEWRLMRARLAYWAWQVITKAVMGVIYLSIICEGIRMVLPVNRRLSELPFLGWMDDYEGTYELDLATLMSMAMLVTVWMTWQHLLKLWVTEKVGFDRRLRQLNNTDSFMLMLGGFLLFAESFMFYIAVTEMSWSSSSFSFTSLFATIAYVSVLVFTIFTSVNLCEKIELIEREPINEQSF